MRSTLCITAALSLCASLVPASAQTAEPATFQLTETTWTFTGKDGAEIVESIDKDGNYVAKTVDGKHLDHGKAVMKDGKACFTSAMANGSTCWTTKPVKIGESLVATNDQGGTLKVTRVNYKPQGM